MRAEVLVVGRQRQVFAKRLERLVGHEAGPERRDLEQDPARLAEVDRLETEPVDDRRRARAGLGDPLTPRGVVFHRRGPGDVMNGSRTRDPALLGRHVVLVDAAARLAARLPLVRSAGSEAERLLEEAAARVAVRLAREGA